MEKRRISISVGRLLLIIIILTIIYISLSSLLPIIIKIIQDASITSKADESQSKRINYSTYFNKHFISNQDKEIILSMFPNHKIKAKVYYNIYGNMIFEADEVLDLSNVQIDSTLTEKLRIIPNLKQVILYNHSLTKDEKILLQDTFPNIKFSWMVDVLGEEIDSNTEFLDLSNKTISDIEDFKKSLKLLPNLKKLDMSYTNLTNEQLGELRQLFPNIRIDWVVYLSKWSLRTDAVAFSVLVTQFDYRRMTSEDIQVLKYCTELQALDLGHQAIQDISVIGEYLPNLRVLILADNKIKDISPLANLKHLHYLELFMNDITDVQPLSNCKELVDLNICFNYRFSDVQGILDLHLLERLWLINDRISKQSYDLIRQTYPNVKLVTTGSGSTNSGWRTHERYWTMIDMFRNNYISDVFLKYDNK